MKTSIDLSLYSNPRYRGKHIVVSGKSVFAASSPKKAMQLFDKLSKRFPQKTLTVTYIPKEETLILNNG